MEKWRLTASSQSCPIWQDIYGFSEMQIVVFYDDGSHESYCSHKAADMDDLRYDQAEDEPETHQ